MPNKIPQLNKCGYLPKGIHKATIQQIKERFGKSSERRKELFGNFLAVVELVKKIRKTVVHFFLDGSFVTAKEHPGDIDCIIIIKNNFDIEAKEAIQLHNATELFNCHILFAEQDDKRLKKEYIDFFSYDINEIPKGLLEVAL
ncbi:MAG: hypothetical protein ABIK21_09910 [bacterium]